MAFMEPGLSRSRVKAATGLPSALRLDDSHVVPHRRRLCASGLFRSFLALVEHARRARRPLSFPV